MPRMKATENFGNPAIEVQHHQPTSDEKRRKM